MFDNIRVFKNKTVIPRKQHQCINCGSKIKVKQQCVNITYSYDGRLISVYFCKSKECKL